MSSDDDSYEEDSYEEPTNDSPTNASEPKPESESDSDSDSDSEPESSSDEEEKDESKPKRERDIEPIYTRPQDLFPDEDDNSPEANIRLLTAFLNSKRAKRRREEDENYHVSYEDLYNFPKDKENWKEEDLKELWGDAPLKSTKPGWDPNWADEEDWDIIREELKAGNDPPYAPFYIPYRKYYPVIPDNHRDISTPKAVIEELDRIEEFLTWVSYIFEDGSSYEGTVWDDLAHGKGVYVAEQGMVRYEGEWLQNNMEGHGVVEVDIPDIEPVPGSKLEEEMRAEGRIFRRDFMSPEDREWLEMDIEDSMRLVNGNYVVPFYESEEWVKVFGMKPEKGRYRYAGQWKHGRMHGCGVYEFDEQPIYGRFYFGELLDDPYGCDENISMMHAGIAEVAAAKARMFINKPDGMVREERGPYSDPQHPYFYEEEDVWMAPGFINQFYDVPDLWKTYVNEVDQEREMWLNSFYKAPLRLPMPAELEHWWSKDEEPEFVVINKEPEPDPNDPSKLLYTEDPLILHTPSGSIINYVEDEEHGIRLFWQPPLKDGEDVDPKKAKFLPLGYDEFFGEMDAKKETLLKRVMTKVENTFKPLFDKLEKWTEEKKKESEEKIELLKEEMELVEAEICLEEVIEDVSEELERQEMEEEERAEKGIEEEEAVSMPGDLEEKTSAEGEDELEEEEGDEDDDDTADSSFGSVVTDQDAKEDQDGNKPGKSPFASCSLSFASYSLWSKAPPKQQQSYSSRKDKQLMPSDVDAVVFSDTVDSVSFPLVLRHVSRLRAACKQSGQKTCMGSHSRHKASQFHSLSRLLSGNPKKSTGEQTSRGRQNWFKAAPESDLDTIFSLNIPVPVNSHFLPHVSPHP